MICITRLLCVTCLIGMLAGCSEVGAPTAPASELTPAAFNTAGAPTVAFSVPDMMCPEGCGAKVQETLAGQVGAREVYVDFEAKTATVAVENGKFDADAALAALLDHGFDHSTLKGEDGTEPQAGEEAVVQ
jgi:copper chaperone CopZ